MYAGKRAVYTSLIILDSIIVTACGAPLRPDISNDAVEDFIFASQLEEVREIRTDTNDSWHVINEQFATYEGRRESFLLQFNPTCRSLEDDYTRQVDVRRHHHKIYARFDTIRGCLIEKMYSISEDQRVELVSLGDAPGADDTSLDTR